IPTYQLMQQMRKSLLGKGVQILDRIQITELSHDENSPGWGALGFNIRNGEMVKMEARAVVLAAGGCSYRGPFFGQDVVSGEGLEMACRAGASLAYMEYGNHFNVSLKAFDTYGQSKFMAHGGKYINRNQEPFLETSGEGNRASGHIAVRRMVEEVERGRGPIYLDLRNFTEQDLVSKLMPNLDLLLHSSSLDFYGTPNEAIPGLTGTSNASGAGVLIDKNSRTSVPGLFAAGDNASKGVVTGACVGLSGISLAWANVTGYLAGKNAAEYASITERSPVINSTRGNGDGIYQPMSIKGTFHPREIIWRLSAIMGNAYVNIIKSEERLKRASHQCQQLKELLYHDTAVSSYHDLMVWYEAKSALFTANLTLEASRFRQETRGAHYREDFPEKNTSLEGRVLVASQANGQPELSYHHLSG
ncbi:MAG TPA: FAD-binding protein, partial [Clostridia bacterium]|nr:FAD-binding protein [Clostridia bacterium]